MQSVHDQAAVEDFRRQYRLDPHVIAQLRRRLYKQSVADQEVLSVLPAASDDGWQASMALHALTLVERHDSKIDGASKLLFQTASGDQVETVILRIATGRTTLCLSSQVGCAVGCTFCATGKMGLLRQLTMPEIIDQIVQANQLLAAEDRRVRNVVFMGMGEPMHNRTHVAEALSLLRSPRGFGLSDSRMIVSTVGVPEAMGPWAEQFPSIRLAVSLHSARQSVRSKLIPLAERYSLSALRQAMEAVSTIQGGRPIMIEYLMLRDLNDTDEDLAALSDYLRGLPVHINLIPYNQTDVADEFQGTEAARRTIFSDRLKAMGFTVTQRYSLGQDIAAGCGQLVQEKLK